MYLCMFCQVEKEELIVPLTMRKTITRGEEFVRFYRNDEVSMLEMFICLLFNFFFGNEAIGSACLSLITWLCLYLLTFYIPKLIIVVIPMV